MMYRGRNAAGGAVHAAPRAGNHVPRFAQVFHKVTVTRPMTRDATCIRLQSKTRPRVPGSAPKSTASLSAPIRHGVAESRASPPDRGQPALLGGTMCSPAPSADETCRPDRRDYSAATASTPTSCGIAPQPCQALSLVRSSRNNLSTTPTRIGRRCAPSAREVRPAVASPSRNRMRRTGPRRVGCHGRRNRRGERPRPRSLATGLGARARTESCRLFVVIKSTCISCWETVPIAVARPA